MRIFLASLAAACILSLGLVVSLADDTKESPRVTGVLIDQACGAKMMDKDDPEKAAAEHPRACAMKEACEKSGYAVISGKTMWKLDAKGNTLAKEFLAKSTKDADIRVLVEGAKKGDEIAVEGIVAAPEAK